MSCLITGRLTNILINLLCLVRSFNNALFRGVSAKFCYIGKVSFHEPRNPESCRISSAYFLCDIKIHFFEYANSIPRKYFKFLRSLM